MRIYKIGLGILLSAFFSLNILAQDLKNPNGYVQVFEVKSDNCPVENDKFIFENDTLKITYYFWASRGIMQMGIKNKLDVPIFINWQNSYYKNTTDKLSYAPEGELNDDNINLYNKYMYGGRQLTAMDYSLSYQTASSDEFKTKVEMITEIKPNGYYMRLKYYIIADDIYTFDETATKITQPNNSNPKKNSDVYEKTFTESDSPFKFESYTQYSTTTEFANASVAHHNFWVSKAQEIEGKHFRGVKIGKSPDGYSNYKFPFKKTTSFYHEIDKKNSIIYKNSK